MFTYAWAMGALCAEGAARVSAITHQSCEVIQRIELRKLRGVSLGTCSGDKLPPLIIL
jgi:hypothetical protein